jgi:protein ImuB
LTGALERLGLKRIGDLLPLPRASLAARFGPGLIARLDEVRGHADGPISPRLPVPPHLARLAFAEPIGRTEDVNLAARRLAAMLVPALEAAGRGARRLELVLHRVDGEALRLRVGTSRATRDPAHICRLFALELDGIDAGFGIEVMVLAAVAVEPLAPEQAVLDPTVGDDPAGLARLVDRLEGRLGAGAVVRAVPRQSHCPERAVRLAPPFAPLPDARWPAGPPRPVRLLPRPLPVEAVAPVPDDPPLLFRHGRRVHRIARADGPERIAPEWWRADGPTRDYYRVEDTAGRRFWLSRAGLYDPDVPARWFLHGVFG